MQTGVASESTKLVERVGETPPREAVTVGGHAFILHFRSDVVSHVAAALGVTAEPVGLDPGAEKSARIVVLLVAPYKESSFFLQAIGAMDRALGKDEVASAIIQATSSQEVGAIDGLMGAELPGYLTVRDVMTTRPRSVWPDAPLADAARVMITNRISALPVTSEKGIVLGMVTHRDILRVALPRYLRKITSGEFRVIDPKQDQHSDPRQIPVRDVMDRSVLCVSEEQTLADVASMIVGKGADRYPVVREGVLVGLITRGDIVRRLFGP